MPSTRSDPLEHILLNVLKCTSPDHPFRKALDEAGVLTVDDLFDLELADLKDLTYDDDNGNSKHLSLAGCKTLLSIRSWFQTQPLPEDASGDDTLLTLTPNTLTLFRRQQAHAAPTSGPAVAATTPTVAPLSASLSPADEFKKGIKRDINQFKPFKDAKQWNP